MQVYIFSLAKGANYKMSWLKHHQALATEGYIFIGNVIIPTDFHSIIFQRGRSTTNQKTLVSHMMAV